jgi:plasmid stability protein
LARPRKGEELNASTRVGVRLAPGVRASLEAMAHRHGRSITDEVRFALTQYVENDKLQGVGPRIPKKRLMTARDRIKAATDRAQFRSQGRNPSKRH